MPLIDTAVLADGKRMHPNPSIERSDEAFFILL